MTRDEFRGVWVAMVTPEDNERRASRRDVSGGTSRYCPPCRYQLKRSRL